MKFIHLQAWIFSHFKFPSQLPSCYLIFIAFLHLLTAAVLCSHLPAVPGRRELAKNKYLLPPVIFIILECSLTLHLEEFSFTMKEKCMKNVRLIHAHATLLLAARWWRSHQQQRRYLMTLEAIESLWKRSRRWDKVIGKITRKLFIFHMWESTKMERSLEGRENWTSSSRPREPRMKTFQFKST